MWSYGVTCWEGLFIVSEREGETEGERETYMQIDGQTDRQTDEHAYCMDDGQIEHIHLTQ